jgi:hypothetical protein
MAHQTAGKTYLDLDHCFSAPLRFIHCFSCSLANSILEKLNWQENKKNYEIVRGHITCITAMRFNQEYTEKVTVVDNQHQD